MATELELKAIELIKSDPVAYRNLQREVARLDPEGRVVPKAALGEVIMEEKIEAAVKPIREQNADLMAKLSKREEIDFHEAQRQVMRRPPYSMSEKQIDDLVSWMEKGGEDGTSFKSYETAHNHRVAMSNVLQPNGNAALPPNTRRHPLTGRVIEKEEWRENFRDPKHALRSNDRQTQRNWAREEATKARQAWRNR